MSSRRGDWEQALAEFLASCEGRAHVYGEHDCLLFAAGAALAITGEDPAEAIRGTYRSQASSIRALQADGARLGHDGTLEGAIDARLPQVPVGFARRGDWALHEGSVGVVAGRYALFVGARIGDGDQPETACLVRVPRAAWEKAWSIGDAA